MKVYKFGGASVKDADGVRNLCRLLQSQSTDDLLVVVSAMGKTTNALEMVISAYLAGNDDWRVNLNQVIQNHRDVLAELVESESDAHTALDKISHYANTFLEQNESTDYDFIYDQIVAIGELMSTKIIASHLREQGLNCHWMDARKLIRTDNNYRNARVKWAETAALVKEMWSGREGGFIITQGFIGGGDHNRITTLGREGSDYSAAIFAHCLDAESVTIWKDVEGVLNADPKYFNNAVLLKNISYREAAELSFYGASVIHPKTIKPLENKRIPLYVKSFLHPNSPGTVINENTALDQHTPSYIFKENQVLISISPRDFAFIVEEHMSDIFARFSSHRVKINTMQNSAISFSVSVDGDPEKVSRLISDLQNDYAVLYNEGLELLTIRHYNDDIPRKLTAGKEILVEQKTRHTLRILMR